MDGREAEDREHMGRLGDGLEHLGLQSIAAHQLLRISPRPDASRLEREANLLDDPVVLRGMRKKYQLFLRNGRLRYGPLNG